MLGFWERGSYRAGVEGTGRKREWGCGRKRDFFRGGRGLGEGGESGGVGKKEGRGGVQLRRRFIFI